MLTREATCQKKRTFSPTPSQSDEELIFACLAGEEQAWEALITKYSRLIYSIPFHHGLGDSESADIFQTVCLKLLENLHSLRDCNKLSSWLITTTSRECWGLTKKRARFAKRDNNTDEEELEQMDPAPLPDDVVMTLEEHQAVRVAVGLLPARCQQLVQYLFYDRSGLSYAQVGKRLSVPEGSVGPLRARCLDRLRLLLENSEWA